MKKRIEYIDLAKGFCIILVVYHHLQYHYPTTPELNRVLSSFRMPLYFFLSGLFFKPYDFLLFVKKKVNKLLIPFLFFYTVTSFLIPILKSILLGNPCEPIELISGIYKENFSNLPIWFLFCLFNTNILFYCIFFISKKINSRSILILLSLLVSIFAFYLSKKSIDLPLYLDTSMSSLIFYLSGYLLAQTNFLYSNKYDKFIPILVFAASIFLILFAPLTNFEANIYKSNYIQLYLSGIIGTLGVLLVSKLIGKLILVSYLGKYSIIILCTHMILIAIITDIVSMMSWAVNINLIVSFLLIILSYLLIIPFMVKFFPHVTAQKDVIK